MMYADPSIELQQEWLLFKHFGSQAINNIHLAIDCNNPPDHVVSEVFSQLIKNYDIFRYSFAMVDNSLKIKINDPQSIHVNVEKIDLSDSRIDDSNFYLAINHLLLIPFDLEQAPLFRPYHIKLSDTASKVLVVIHHLIVDTETVGLLYRDMMSIYNELNSGNQSFQLSRNYAPFSDYMAQKNVNDSLASLPARKFWLDNLGGEIDDLFMGDLISHEENHAHKQALANHIKHIAALNHIDLRFSLVFLLHKNTPNDMRGHAAMLGRDMVERIENTARLSGASVLSVLASCFYITLNKLTQKTNIPLGFINSGKDSAELNNTPGNMVNTLILKQEVAENISVMEFISQTHQSIVTMRANAGVSIPCIWKDLGLQDNINIPACLNYVVVPNGIPLYESLVNEKDITFKGYPSSNLDIVIFKSDDCIVFKYNYKINMFSPANVENIEMEFRSNLLDMLDNPHGLIMTDAQLDYV